MNKVLMFLKNILLLLNLYFIFSFDVDKKFIEANLFIVILLFYTLISFWDLIRNRKINLDSRYNIFAIVILSFNIFILNRVNLDVLLFDNLFVLNYEDFKYNAQITFNDANAFYLVILNLCLVLYNIVNRDTRFIFGFKDKCSGKRLVGCIKK